MKFQNIQIRQRRRSTDQNNMAAMGRGMVNMDHLGEREREGGREQGREREKEGRREGGR